MDFFEHQDKARKRTTRLVILFAIAVVATVGAIDAAVYYYLKYQAQWEELNKPPNQVVPFTFEQAFPMLLGVSVCVLAVILIGTLFKLFELRGGGHVVAESLGGKLVDSATGDPLERKVLNVVEEMAIASGTPVPPVYVMESETSINAFAAGYRIDDAVVGVTRGCIQELSRDELQGVIAHEFSHILNGDMRLSIRLMGVLHGILAIGLIGRTLFRIAFYTGGGRSRKSGQLTLPLIAAGAILAIVGSIGLFFGKLIKAAVSRQREFLADASAVQFTRNPGGIGGALAKIRDFANGSRIHHPRGSLISHMYFSEGFSHMISGVFSTHPPLDERILRVLPEAQAVLTKPAAVAAPLESGAREAQAMGFAGGDATTIQMAAASVAALQVGIPSTGHIEYASALIQSIPPELVEACRSPFSARAIVYAALLDTDEQVRLRQWQQLTHHADPAVFEETQRLEATVRQTPRNARMTLISLATPSLKSMSRGQYERFMQNVDALIQADKWVDIFEWSIRRLVATALQTQFRGKARERKQIRNLQRLKSQCATLLSLLAHAGHSTPEDVDKSFGQARDHLGFADFVLKPTKQCSFPQLDAALDVMGHLVFSERKRLLDACVVCVAADGKITVAEGELLRAIADSLGCPAPPLLPGQTL